MLIQAQISSGQSRRVCLIEKEGQIGGMWRKTTSDTGLDFEIGCHLIESLPGVYEFLEEMSGERFVEIDIPPVRVTRSGVTFNYLSRTLLMIAGLRMLLVVLLLRLRKLASIGYEQEKYMNFSRKLSDFMKFQLPAIFRKQILRAPENGFVSFIENLTATTEAKGTSFQSGDVMEAWYADGLWHVKLSDGAVLKSRRVFCSSSVNLVPDGDRLCRSEATSKRKRKSVVIEVRNELVRNSYEYAAFWKHDAISRLSRLRSPDLGSNSMMFLVELRKLSEAGLEVTLAKALEIAKVTFNGAEFKIVGENLCEYSSNVAQLNLTDADRNFFTLNSYGNLAMGVARYLSDAEMYVAEAPPQ